MGTIEAGHYDLHKLHAKEEVAMAQTRWKEFAGTLNEADGSRLRVTTTPLILTHSIGIYDQPMYVNAFCAGLDSPDLPSFRIEPHAPAYASYVRDALEHVAASSQLCGARSETFLSESLH